ncbi:ATP-binding protein [Fodinicola acaciae]|uniref:ATP-binding protein n=1 Tax=Fodinicola acaciae TaxID=2681555 RepID=UPI0013D8263D|nr:ATP-binding protein [Fodinicola acaciae]
MSSPSVEPRRLHRQPRGWLIAGVASGIAEHLNVPVIAVRIAFVLLTVLVSGAGALLYVAWWIFAPLAPTEPDERRPRDFGQLAAFMLLSLGLAVVAAGAGLLAWLVFVLPALVLIVGATLLWRRSDPERWRRIVARLPGPAWLEELATSRGWLPLVARIGIGLVLVVLGMAGFLTISGQLQNVQSSLVFGLVLIGGCAVVVAPLLWRMFAELRAERAERIRSQTRADVAAIVHDQVLHTLALIQRNAEDAREVSRLARGQERQLRNWLYKPMGSPDERLAAALEEAAAEVEDTYAVSVDTVIVGDCPVDEHVQALVQAAREALVNAGKHAKVSTVSLYAEVEDGTASVFVRDRGTGFDLDTVADDRHGVSGSIVDRMRRHGGSAEIRTAPESGTEVRLKMGLAR